MPYNGAQDNQVHQTIRFDFPPYNHPNFDSAGFTKMRGEIIIAISS